jgi:hypothetical protein
MKESKEAQSLVAYKDGRLDVAIENRTLEWTLVQISQQSGVPIVSASGLGAHPLSIRFEKLSLEEGLRRILKGYDVFFFLSADDKATSPLKGVWIYPKGLGHGFAPQAPETGASLTEISRYLSDRDPAMRAWAVDVLIARKGPQSLPSVLQALTDPNELVRSKALYQALNSGVALPQDTLKDLVRNDPSPVVRFSALEAIANSNPDDPSAARGIAEFALSDSDPNVRLQARQILDMEHSTARIEPIQGQETQGQEQPKQAQGQEQMPGQDVQGEEQAERQEQHPAR